MRLRRLTLDRYGAFADLTVRFGSRLTVVYGPNEAGKSTITHAIGDLLWGLVPRQHPYAFDVAPSRLQITADVDGANGPRTFTVTGQGRRDAAGAPLDPWWTDGPATGRRAWEVGYGLDRDQLREGGRAVLRDGGDLADLLFRARTGVDLAAARDRLITDAEKLWKRHRGARGQLRSLSAAVDGLGERFTEALHSADTVAELADQLERAEKALGKARVTHARRTAAKEAAQRDERAHPVAVALAAIRHEIAGVAAEGDPLSEDDLASYDEVSDALAAAHEALRNFDADEAELDATPLPVLDPAAMAVADQVDELRRGEQADEQRRARRDELRTKARGALRTVRELATTLDPSLASADDAALRGAAPMLLLPADAVDLLDRVADRVAEAVRAADTARGEVRAAEAELVSDAPNVERVAHSRWEGARQVRDRAWEQIREPWLTGALPDPGTRAALAADLDGALAATDVAAGEAATEAEQYVELRTLTQERQRRLDGAQRALTALVDERDDRAGEWRRTVRDCGLPEALDVTAWHVRRGIAAQLSGLLLDLTEFDAHAKKLEGENERFQERVMDVARDLGIGGPDARTALATAHRRVADAREASLASAERERQRAAIAGKRATTETRRDQAARTLATLQARSPEADLDTLVDRSRKLLELRERERATLDQLRAAAPGDDPDDLVARLATMPREQVLQGRDEAEGAAADALDDLEEAKERRTRLSDELRAAQQDRDAAVLRQQQVDALDEMAELARRWARLHLMAGLLNRVARADGADADASLLAHASALARTLTAGRVEGLHAVESPGEGRTLAVRLSGDLDVEATGLSEGTADQVFLSLRMAGIRQRQEIARAAGAETLPVVLDDVLMAHDDPRTVAALGLLFDEARDQQIILFTHHRAVAEAAGETGATAATLEPPVRPSTRADGVDPARVRAWAREHGIAMSARGRIPKEVLAAYHAHGSSDPHVGD